MKTRNVMIYSPRSFDDSEFVHQTLYQLHRQRPICIVAHLGYGAGGYASAWSRVAKPAVSEFISRADKPQTAAKAIMESTIDLLVIFGRSKNEKLRKLARDRGIAIFEANRVGADLIILREEKRK